MGGKGGKNQKQESSYAIRDIVLAKVRGFPPWPGMVVDPDNVPPLVGKERPSSKKTTFYCVRFFPAGDYAWLVAKDISKLQTHEIQAYINEPFKRSGDLLSGYRIALNPRPWEEEREAAELDAAEQEGNAEVDQLDSENEDDEEPKPVKSKKRKRESEATPAKSKAKSKPKKDSEESTGKKKGAALSKGKKNGTKSKEMVESEDEGDNAEAEAEDDDAGPSQKVPPPPAKKAKREKDNDEADAALEDDPEARKVREWRHRLQKALLSNKGIPKDEDMPALDELFTMVENYKNINIQYLSFSKIGKVMRHIAALSAERVPRDEEFHFRDRARTLVDKWHAILGSSKSHENGVESGTNGTATAHETSQPEAGAQDAIKTDEETAEIANGGAEVEMQTDDKAEAPAEADVEAETEAEAEGEAEAEAEAEGEVEAEGEEVDMSKEEDNEEGDLSALDVTMSEA